MIGIGIIVPQTSADDHFITALVNALANPIVEAGMGLFTSVVENEKSEKKLYRHWSSSGIISGVVLLGASVKDSRIELLRSLGMPFIAVVDSDTDLDFPAVVIDVAASIEALGSFLTPKSREQNFYITSQNETTDTKSRASAISEYFEVIRTDLTTESAVDVVNNAPQGSQVTILFDNDVDSAAALSRFAEIGVKVPEIAAIISWTDSILCQSTSPSITAINRRGSEIGAMLGSSLLKAINGGISSLEYAPEPFIVVRESV